MSFASNLFVLFLVAFFVPYLVIPALRRDERTKHLYVALWSFLFYGTWYPPALVLIGFHTLLGHLGARWLAASATRLRLAVLTVVGLAPLVFFKLFDFFVDTVGLEHLRLDLVLPLGISFYTFSVLGYLVDVYRGDEEPLPTLTDVALFVAFWPHLAAGPILRAKTIAEPMDAAEALRPSNVQLALTLISAGLVKKLLIADNIGAYVNWNIGYGTEMLTTLDAWTTMLGFSAQIYADFSGYSDMAIGFALLLGFALPANFNYPYNATSLTDFWRRWHISLSTWFRDYLYFPLGGSRRGLARACVNIMIVFVLSGIWHGAGWSFVVWGAIHGGMLCVEKVAGERYFRIPTAVRWAVTMFLVVVAWTFFRLDIDTASAFMGRMLLITDATATAATSPYHLYPILLMLTLPLIDHVVRFYRVGAHGTVLPNRRPIAVALLALAIVAAFVFNGQELPFIYFEF